MIKSNVKYVSLKFHVVELFIELTIKTPKVFTFFFFFYDLLAKKIISLSLPGWIAKFKELHLAPRLYSRLMPVPSSY